MEKKIIKLLREKFNTFIELRDGKYCVYFEQLDSPNLSTVWFDKGKKVFNTKPIGMSDLLIVDSDTVSLIEYINEQMELKENDLPKVRKVIMDFSHEKIKQHIR